MANATPTPNQGQSSLNLSNVIGAESRRRLAQVSFESSKLKTLDLPRDTVVKRANVQLRGSETVTFAAGSPVFSERGLMQRLCPRIDVVIDGQRSVKSIDPYMQQCLNHIYTGNRPVRRYSTSASAFTTLIAGTDWVNGTVNYPATTQYFLINESIDIHFEMPWAYGLGRESTMLNLKDVSSAEMRFNFASSDNQQRDESSPASVTYSNIDLNFVVTLIEARSVPRDQQFYDFKETVKRVTYTGETRDSLIDLNRGNALAGLAFMAQNGDANKSLGDRVIRDLALLINGQQIVQKTDFHELQIANQNRYGSNDAISSGNHALKGFAFMNLLINGRLDSAINTSIGAGVDQIQAQVTTAPASGVDANTYGTVELAVWQMEVAAVPLKA